MTFLPPQGTEQREEDFVSVQAIPQMQIFLNFTNDILRFKWEKTIQEHQNYIRGLSAYHPGKNLGDTLDEMVTESAVAVQAVDDLLKELEWIEDRWEVLRHGFVAMHRWDKAPYQLKEMGLAEEIIYKNAA